MPAQRPNRARLHLEVERHAVVDVVAFQNGGHFARDAAEFAQKIPHLVQAVLADIDQSEATPLLGVEAVVPHAAGHHVERLGDASAESPHFA